MMTDVMDPVVWPDDPVRQRWWETVLGIGCTVRECATADLVEQQQIVPLDDDLYARTPHARAAPVAD